jgi:hypothetical protein
VLPAPVPEFCISLLESSKDHTAHVSSLSGPGTRPGMRPVIRGRPRWGGYGHVPSLSRCLSAAAVCFLSRPVPATGIRFPRGRPTGGCPLHRTVTGFPCFALVRRDRCRAPPIPRDRGALMADIETSATTATFQRRVLFPGVTSHLPEFWVTRLTGVHFIRPSGLPLACDQ